MCPINAQFTQPFTATYSLHGPHLVHVQEVCLKGVTQLLRYLLVAIASCKQSCSQTILREGCKSERYMKCLYGKNEEVTSKEAHNGRVLIAHIKTEEETTNSVTQAPTLTANGRETTWKQSQLVFGVVNSFRHLHYIKWLTRVEWKSTTACRSMLYRHSKAPAVLCTYMSSLVVLVLRLLHPPLDRECRTLSLRWTFFIWVHITMSVDSVEKSISFHSYSNSHSLLTCIRNRYYATTPKLCQTNFANVSPAEQERW